MGFGCMRLSPFETELDEAERDHTRKNLSRLAARTQPSGPWKLAAIADSHSDYEELAELVEILNERGDLELVLHAGDLTDYGLRQEYRWALDELEELSMPWLTVIGNHDALSNGIEIYRGMFGAFDYSLEWGGVRFVCFNSNRLEFGSSVPDWEFVEDSSIAPDGGAIQLLTHVPPLVPEAADDARFGRLLERPGMLPSLHGHLHGASLRSVGPVPSIVIGGAYALNYVVVTIDGPQASIERCRGRDCAPLEPIP